MQNAKHIVFDYPAALTGASVDERMCPNLVSPWQYGLRPLIVHVRNSEAHRLVPALLPFGGTTETDPRLPALEKECIHHCGVVVLPRGLV